MKKALSVVAIVLGVGFVILAVYYWITPASALPAFFPGYDPTMASVHFKHGLLSLIFAILLFIYAWFNTAKKKQA